MSLSNTSSSKRRLPQQKSFEFKTHGGKRKGAGRKPTGPVARLRHGARPALSPRHPAHVVLSFSRLLPNLRSQRCMRVLRAAFRAGRDRLGFRLAHYAVQKRHIHLVAEAGGARELSRGVKGLSVRIARALNRELGRQGKVFADRYFVRALVTPSEVRNGLAYVLLQERHHRAQAGLGSSTVLDACSSGGCFDGWKGRAPREGPWSETVVPPRTWLLTVGWRRRGLVDPAEVPGMPRGSSFHGGSAPASWVSCS